jgi:hypothetical protein
MIPLLHAMPQLVTVQLGVLLPSSSYLFATTSHADYFCFLLGTQLLTVQLGVLLYSRYNVAR